MAGGIAFAFSPAMNGTYPFLPDHSHSLFAAQFEPARITFLIRFLRRN
jgi:hypothetical protein